MNPDYLIIGLAITLLLISFVSGVDAAFFSASRLAIELKKKQGRYSGRVWSEYFQSPSRFVSTSILVYTVLLVIFGYLWWAILGTIWQYWGIENVYWRLVAAIFVSSASLLLIELFFRSLFHARSTAVIGSGFVTFLISALFALFQWSSAAIVRASDWILKYLFNVKLNPKIEAFSKPDIDVFIQQLKHNEHTEGHEKGSEIFANMISLSETKLKACLVPRREIIGVKDRISIDELTRVFSETKLSKLIVYHESIDDIKGYVHQLDLFKNPADIKAILLPIPIVPESMTAKDLIKKFSKERKSIAWVIDEFGGTAGIVTMEDLLEEIFGDINDEFDISSDFVDKQISPHEYILSGRLPLNDIAEKYKLQFRENQDAETLSGYIVNQSGGIPRLKDRIIIDNYQFDIISVAKTRIDAVRLKVLR